MAALMAVRWVKLLLLLPWYCMPGSSAEAVCVACRVGTFA